jgi:hypothetical protein
VRGARVEQRRGQELERDVAGGVVSVAPDQADPALVACDLLGQAEVEE